MDRNEMMKLVGPTYLLSPLDRSRLGGQQVVEWVATYYGNKWHLHARDSARTMCGRKFDPSTARTLMDADQVVVCAHCTRVRERYYE